MNSHIEGMERFSKKVRLTSQEEFKRAIYARRMALGPHFTACFAHNSGSFSRLGIAIPKKKIAKTHDRNRIKRQIRETFRKSRGRLGCLDVVIMVNKSVNQLKKSEMARFLDELWKKLACVSKKS